MVPKPAQGHAAPTNTEKLVALKEAASIIGIPYSKLLKASNAGLFPRYTLLNQRTLVRVSEIVAAIESTRKGGDQ